LERKRVYLRGSVVTEAGKKRLWTKNKDAPLLRVKNRSLSRTHTTRVREGNGRGGGVEYVTVRSGERKKKSYWSGPSRPVYIWGNCWQLITQCNLVPADAVQTTTTICERDSPFSHKTTPRKFI